MSFFQLSSGTASPTTVARIDAAKPALSSKSSARSISAWMPSVPGAPERM